jgi:hypothetical protein
MAQKYQISNDMYSVLNCHDVEKRTQFPLGMLWLMSSHKKKSRGIRSGERGGHVIGAAPLIHQTEKQVLMCSRTPLGNEGVGRLAGSECVVLGHPRLTVE